MSRGDFYNIAHTASSVIILILEGDMAISISQLIDLI